MPTWCNIERFLYLDRIPARLIALQGFFHVLLIPISAITAELISKYKNRDLVSDPAPPEGREPTPNPSRGGGECPALGLICNPTAPIGGQGGSRSPPM